MRSFSVAVVFAALAAVASAASFAYDVNAGYDNLNVLNDYGITADDLNALSLAGYDLDSLGLGDLGLAGYGGGVDLGVANYGDNFGFNNVAGVDLHGGDLLNIDDAANILYGIKSNGYNVNTLQVNPMVDMVSSGSNVGYIGAAGQLAEFENGGVSGPGIDINNYISEPIPDYQAVSGVLPLLGGANFLEQDSHIQTSANVAVPMPEVAIPVPEPTDLTATLPTAVADINTTPTFEALLHTIFSGDIAGLGIATADLVPEVISYASTPDVDAVPVLPVVPDLAAAIPTLSDDQIATLLVNHGADGFRVADMAANLNAYLGNANTAGDVAVANGMNSMINSAGENWQNIANIRKSLADLLGGVQRDQSTAVKEGLATFLAGAGESKEKTNLIAQALASAFIKTAVDQQAAVNAGVNNLVQSNIGNMDNANTIINQLAEAFSASQASNTPVLNNNLNALIALVASNMPKPTDGAVLNPGVPVGSYVAGASSAAIGNPELDALAMAAGRGSDNGYYIADNAVGFDGDVLAASAGAGGIDVSALGLSDYINGIADDIRTGRVSVGDNGDAVKEALTAFVTNNGWDKFLV